MIDANSICARASEILEANGHKKELSEQAKAVVQSIVETLQQLDNQAAIRMENAVTTKVNGHMKRPTMDEVVLHGSKTGLPKEQCMAFYDHYEANGWKVGRVPMKLWTAAMSNWKRTWLVDNPRFQSNGEVSLRDVKNLCREKYSDQMEWMAWASSFYNHWAKRKWLKNGQLIDWKEELSAQISRWKQAKQTTKA